MDPTDLFKNVPRWALLLILTGTTALSFKYVDFKDQNTEARFKTLESQQAPRDKKIDWHEKRITILETTQNRLITVSEDGLKLSRDANTKLDRLLDKRR